jgi:hypothetical protein
MDVTDQRAKVNQVRTAHARFSTKSFRPASRSPPGVSAGSQPRTVHDSESGGGSGNRDTAKAGCVSESGVGGETRW